MNSIYYHVFGKWREIPAKDNIGWVVEHEDGLSLVYTSHPKASVYFCFRDEAWDVAHFLNKRKPMTKKNWGRLKEIDKELGWSIKNNGCLTECFAT